VSCERPSECIESAGATKIKDITVEAFSKIKVYRGIEVVITEGAETKVQIQAGENFINDIEVKQYGNQLVFKDNSGCNWVRDYGQTKIFITTPTLEEIYSKTDRDISSNGVLTFQNLNIISFDIDADGESGAGTGDFILEINNNSLTISNNNLSRFYLSGQTNNANFNFYFGDGRIEAEEFTIQNLYVYHRGSNDMIVKPMQSLTGTLNSTGNVILKNVPPLVDVEELYQGNVIYP
jgi:uncharacterized pyridoxamine 5'-phosphate oxidase family protein